VFFLERSIFLFVCLVASLEPTADSGSLPVAWKQLLSGHSVGFLTARKAIIVGSVKIQTAIMVEELVEIWNDVLVDRWVVDHQHNLAV
jgi:hypothetical protein